MDEMTRPRPPYLLRETARGKTFWYVRRGDGPRIRVRGEYGSDEFMAHYHQAISGIETAPKPKASTGTLLWLVTRYQESAAFLTLAPSTQSLRRNILSERLQDGR